MLSEGRLAAGGRVSWGLGELGAGSRPASQAILTFRFLSWVVVTQVPALCKNSLCCILRAVHVSTCTIYFDKTLHRNLLAEVALKSN